MRYNSIIENDVSNGEGFHVSFFVQGCPHHCKGCFNPETWDFHSGKEYTPEVEERIIKAIGANDIQRNFSILGGEPLAIQNLTMVSNLVKKVRETYPTIKIYLWTGYYLEDLDNKNSDIKKILDNINYLIDGPFIEEEKNLNLRLRGSNNQRLWHQIAPRIWQKIKEK